jgi:hypothetical protein
MSTARMRDFVLLVLAAFVIVWGLILSANGCKNNDTATPPPVVTPVTDDLFPLVVGHRYEYTGFLVDTNSVESPINSTIGAYVGIWTLLPGPAGTWLIQDSTTVLGVTSLRYFQIKKATATGDISFRQTLGPFYRAIGATYTDTLAWIELAKPSVGVGATWTAFDTTVVGHVNGLTGDVHLQIFGKIEGQFSITDSSTAHNVYPHAYRIRTWRKISAGGFVIQDDATTARLWLVADIGPVQVNISGDTENYGLFRVLTGKNF